MTARRREGSGGEGQVGPWTTALHATRPRHCTSRALSYLAPPDPALDRHTHHTHLLRVDLPERWRRYGEQAAQPEPEPD